MTGDGAVVLVASGAHRRADDGRDAPPEPRRAPRHRARRPRWRPPSETVQPQHAEHRETLFG